MQIPAKNYKRLFAKEQLPAKKVLNLLVGPKDTGKTTVLNTILAVLQEGQYGKEVDNTLLMQSKTDKTRGPEMAAFMDTLMVCSSESNESDKLDTAKVKALPRNTNTPRSQLAIIYVVIIRQFTVFFSMWYFFVSSMSLRILKRNAHQSNLVLQRMLMGVLYWCFYPAQAKNAVMSASRPRPPDDRRRSRRSSYNSRRSWTCRAFCPTTGSSQLRRRGG